MLKKINFADFESFNLVTTNLKSFVGGGTPTNRNIPGDKSSGPDSIDECTDVTRFADGSSDSDVIKK